MLKLKKRYIALIVFGFLFIYNTYIPSWLITGSYISKIDYPSEAHGLKDHENLRIFSNGTFKGDTWGKGTWKIKHGFGGTEIHFDFNNEGFSTYFYRRMFFSKPRIVIFRDLSLEFLKTE